MPGTTIPQLRGLDGIIATSTRLSHVDGLGGELISRGYELKELAGRVSFEETAPAVRARRRGLDERQTITERSRYDG